MPPPHLQSRSTFRLENYHGLSTLAYQVAFRFQSEGWSLEVVAERISRDLTNTYIRRRLARQLAYRLGRQGRAGLRFPRDYLFQRRLFYYNSNEEGETL